MLRCVFEVFDTSLPAKSGTLVARGALRRCNAPATHATTREEWPLCIEHADSARHALFELSTELRKRGTQREDGSIACDEEGDYVLSKEDDTQEEAKT